MLVDDGIKLIGSSRVVVGNVTTLHAGTENDVVYLTEQDDTFSPGLYTFNGIEWVTLSGEEIITVMSGLLLHTLDNPEPGQTDYFGWSVAIDGNHCIVGAHLDDSGGSDSGEAYIFNTVTGALVHTLENPNAGGTKAGDQFGITVSISGNHCIVGAPREDVGGSNSGIAYIFDVTTGSLVYTLNNPSPSQDDYFGSAVAISGNHCIVGALYEDDAGSNSGKAYIYDVTTGNLVHTLSNPNAYGTSVADFFGEAVAIDGNHCIVGATGEADSEGLSSGKAYIFNVTTGNLVHILDNPNAFGTSTNDRFGYTVAISGNHCIVGAYDEDDSASLDDATSGKAYIFNVNTGALVHTLDNPNTFGTRRNDYFGFAVSISGNTCIVSAYQEDVGGSGSGTVYVFDVTTGQLLYTLNNPNVNVTSAADQFGGAVAISGNTCVIGARLEDDPGFTNSGKAYIFV